MLQICKFIHTCYIKTGESVWIRNNGPFRLAKNCIYVIFKINCQVSSEESCTLTYSNNLMKIDGWDHIASYETKYKEFDNFDNDTLAEFNLISEQHPTASKMSSDFNTYKMSLQQINSQINQVKTERRNFLGPSNWRTNSF